MTAFSLATSSCGIETPLVGPNSRNFKIGSWPPADDFPIVIDAAGQVVSKYSDPTWKLWPWCHHTLSINFMETPVRKGVPTISTPNAKILRMIAAWMIYGPEPVKSASSLKRKIESVKSIFKISSREGVLVTELSRFPAVIDTIAKEIAPQFGPQLIYVMHQLLDQQYSLGFCILDQSALRRLSAAIPQEFNSQTAYIPPRIWNYQVERLSEFLQDFQKNKQNLIDCFRFCLGAYEEAYGSIERACTTTTKGSKRNSPFSGTTRKYKKFGQKGEFVETAKLFGLLDLFDKWVLPEGASLSDPGRGVSTFSNYFSMANTVCLAYILNFSLMRINEAWSLRTDCMEIEDDEVFGKIYLLKGVTTKTIEDDDARWITSPTVTLAVEVATCVSKLRSICERANLSVTDNTFASSTPFLFVRAQEPWAGTATQIKGVRHIYPSYSASLKSYPKLMDKKELTITPRDMEIARLVTPTLDTERILEGEVWPLAWHQLRRTGAVNMQTSGLVSDAAIQYQLKHASRAMSLYYGRGYASLRLNQSARNEFIKTMYEILAKEITALASDRFISPYGNSRKSDILKVISQADQKKLLLAANKGEVSWRATLFGGCTKRGFCEYGGIDNVARCGGGDGKSPCTEALFDREKKSRIREFEEIVNIRLDTAPADSPYKESLLAQKRAIENALRIIESYEIT